jgi:hypothetical protein
LESRGPFTEEQREQIERELQFHQDRVETAREQQDYLDWEIRIHEYDLRFRNRLVAVVSAAAPRTAARDETEHSA